jgi:two-component system, OmpR family, phosphate regulon sensor histidine kinase PhoR
MKFPSFYSTPVVTSVLGAIVLSTAMMAILSYRYTVGPENLVESSLVQSNTNLARQCVDRIEQKIIDNDRIIVDLADVNDPARWPEISAQIRNGDFNVEQVYFLSSGRDYPPLYPPYSHEIRNAWGAYKSIFKVSELDVRKLVLDQPHHLHMERPNNYYFASYAVKENDKGEKIVVCFQMNYEKIIALLDNYLRPLLPTCYVAVVDFENNGVFNGPIPRSGKYFYEIRFPSTLYKWILQVVPRNYNELEREVRASRRANFGFIIFSTSLTFISLAILFLAGRRDRQLRKLKEDFIGNVSHELKTPLSLIRMFSEMLCTGRVRNDESRQEYHRIIYNESDRMSRLINNLLDFASLEKERRTRHFEVTDVGQLVTKELEAYRQQIQKDGFQVEASVDPGVPETWADPNSLTMAFFNLLDNAVKYSGDERTVEVRVARTNSFIDLSVRDRGIGIPVKEQQKIFEKFYRGSHELVKRTRGSGIGLAITRNVAEMHGGEVLVESEPGKGSTFTIRIPVRRQPELAD